MKVPSRQFGTVTCSIEGCDAKLITEYGVSIGPEDESSKWLSVGSIYCGRTYVFCPDHAVPIKMTLDTL